MGACLIIAALVGFAGGQGTFGSRVLSLRGRGKVTARLRAILDEHGPALEQLAGKDERLASALEAAIDAALAWEPLGVDDTAALCKADLAVGCSFGAGPGSMGPYGQQNYALASSAGKLAAACKERGAAAPPLFLQWEIADALKERSNITAAYRIGIPAGADYISTSEVISTCAAELTRRRIVPPKRSPRVALLAHPDHAWRVAALARAAGWDPLVVGGNLAPDWEEFGCDADGYTQESAQPWTRDRAAFVAHELWARAKEIADGNIEG